MPDFEKISQVARMNASLREKGGFACREFDRVIETFDKVLLFKERIRLTLEQKLGALRAQVEANLHQLQILVRNISIYDNNLSKIDSNLKQLDREEGDIRKSYEKMLRGASLAELPDTSHFSGGDADEDNGFSREKLTLRRREYLENLNNSFRQMDEELYSIDGLRREMLQARSEIQLKKGEALQKKEIFVDNDKRFQDEVKRIETELDKSINEEQVLITEFSSLLHKVQGCIEISDEIDHVLFSSLTASETPSVSKPVTR